MSQAPPEGGEHGVLSNRNGFMYFPAHAFNTYQMWWDYRPEQIERDMAVASKLGFDMIRFFLSYEFWKEEARDDSPGNAHLARLNHFISTCESEGIDMLPVFFESIGDAPTKKNLRDTNIETSFAVRSPSLTTIGLRNWTGTFSPMHFVRRITNMLNGNANVLAFEAMNEPGNENGAPARIDFVRDMLTAMKQEDPGRRITVGCKTIENNFQYLDHPDCPDVHILQYHHNLPVDEGHFAEVATEAREAANARGLPLWLTEWQRFRGPKYEPPSRFLPHPANMADTIHTALDEGLLDGACLWGLMLKPAYIKPPREAGRINGVMHPDGVPFNLDDVEALAGGPVPGMDQHRRSLPAWMANSSFPFPDPAEEFPDDEPCAAEGTCMPPPGEDDGSDRRAALAIGAALAGTYGLSKLFD